MDGKTRPFLARCGSVLRSTVLGAPAIVVLRSFAGGGNLGPYLLAGGGLKRYHFFPTLGLILG
jgi:hypothetical protein